MTDESRLRLLSSRTAVGSLSPRMVLDTDTYNEIDDQFALTHAVLAADRVRLEAIYAAPFHNAKSSGPGDGMRRSYEEIHLVLSAIGHTGTPVFEGATEWLNDSRRGRVSPATEDLINRAGTAPGEPLYVVAIGAATNISNALLVAPEIVDRIVVVWLGGNSFYWPTAREFNLQQDVRAARVLFESGVALVHVPCFNVADHLTTTRDEIERYVRPAAKIGEFLAERYAGHVAEGPGVSKVIWDLAAVGWLLEPSWTKSVLLHSPVLTEEMTWSHDLGRHFIREVTYVKRDAIFGDLFRRLADHAAK